MPDLYSPDEQLLQQLPLPLAQLCRRACNGRTPLERHQAAFYLWEAALKLLACVAVVEYAESRSHDPQLVERLKNLARPSLGHWWEFVRRLVPVLAQRGDSGFTAVRDLVLGRARDDLPRSAGLDALLLEVLDGRSGPRSTVRLTELIDRLVQYRNREFGHGAAGQRSPDHYERLARALLAGATEVLGRLDVLAGRRLLAIGEVRRQASGHWLVELFALTGESAKRLESLEFPETQADRLPRPEQVYLGTARGAPVLHALHPLVFFDAQSGQAYLLNARRGKRGIEYLCYGSGETLRREELHADHRALLARVLDQAVDPAAAEAWAAASLAEEPASDAGPAEMSGRHIGDFELLSRLGQGGMGVVYRAWQPSLGRQVALKCTLRAGDPKAEARFAREIRALGRVEHPNVVKVFTSGADGDQWFYAMELIEGAELSRVCEKLAGSSAAEIDASQWRQALTTACEQARSRETQLSATSDPGRMVVPTRSDAADTSARVVPQGGRGHVAQVVEIVRQVAEAAHALHEVGVVHRDIKPGNIMLTADGGHPVLMDLGLAQLADETEGRVTRTRQFVGTLRYASPEQVLAVGRVDRRTDVYSLGATLWELLTLRPLFGVGEETPTPELMLRIQTSDPERPRRYNRHVPRDLEAIVLKCLEKDRVRRYATAADLAADLRRFLAGEPVSAQPPSMTYLTGKFVRRYRVPLAVAGLVLAVLVGSVVAAFIGIDRQRRAALDANEKLQEQRRAALEANEKLQEQLYDNNIAVAERELTLNHDVGLAGDLLQRCPESLRGWEWDYLMRLRDGARLPLGSSPALGTRPAVKGMEGGHKAGVWMAAFSPDGRRVATCSIDGTAKVWDTASGRVLHTFSGHAFLPFPIPGISAIPVLCLAFSPDGRHIASGSFSPKIGKLRESPGVVLVWEVETGHEVLRFDAQVGPVLGLTFSPDGRHIASSSLNTDNSFVVWDARTGAVVRVVRGHTDNVHCLRYSPDGRLLATGAADGGVKLWDVATFRQVHSLDAHPATVSGLAFSPDGARLATAGHDGTVRVWETATAAPALEPLHGHTGAALGVAFSPDGKRIASAGYDKTVRVWDATSGRSKITLRGHTDMVWSVDFSRDGQRLVSGSFDSTARIWDATPLEETSTTGEFSIAGHSDRVNSVAFSPDGRYLASGGWDHTVRLWDARTGEELRTLAGHHASVWCVAFSPDSSRVASASWDKTVKVWDTASGQELVTFAGHKALVHCVAFTPDGKRAASGSLDAYVKIWDTATGKELATCEGGLFPCASVAFSPDGTRLATGGIDRIITIWDANTAKELYTLKGHSGAIPSVAFSPDGKRLVSASWDYSLKVWDVDPMRKVGLFQSRELRPLQGHSDQVNGVAWSADGTRIASAGEDKTVRVWDPNTGQEVMPRRLLRGVVWSVAFSPDSKRLAAGTWSKGSWVKVWKVR
jgi:WD40 repeat protein/serine/threonine protein kinase